MLTGDGVYWNVKSKWKPWPGWTLGRAEMWVIQLPRKVNSLSTAATGCFSFSSTVQHVGACDILSCQSGNKIARCQKKSFLWLLGWAIWQEPLTAGKLYQVSIKSDVSSRALIHSHLWVSSVPSGALREGYVHCHSSCVSVRIEQNRNIAIKKTGHGNS